MHFLEKIEVDCNGSSLLNIYENRLFICGFGPIVTEMNQKEKIINLWYNGEVVRVWALKNYNGKIITGCGDGNLRIWDLKDNNRFRYVNNLNQSSIFSLEIYKNLLFGGDKNGNIICWEINTWEKDNSYETQLHEVSINALISRNDILFSGGSDSKIGCYDLIHKKIIKYLEGHQSQITCFDANNKYLFSGGGDKTVKMWDIYSLTPLFSFDNHDSPISSILVFRRKLFSCCSDGFKSTINIWNISKKNHIETLSTLPGWSSSMVIDHKKRKLYTMIGSKLNIWSILDIPEECILPTIMTLKRKNLCDDIIYKIAEMLFIV